MSKPKGSRPTPASFKPGNKASVGHGGWKVRSWSKVLEDFFTLLKTDPKKLEELTGIKLPENIRWKDGQLILTGKEFLAAIGGSLAASSEVKRWLHGDPQQKVVLEGKSFAQLITEAKNKVSANGPS